MKVSEETFYRDYRPQINHIERANQPESVDDEDVCSYAGSMYETYGEELEYVHGMAQENIKKVWTVVDTEGALVIVAGFSYVNRMGYIITEKEWEDINSYVEEELNPRCKRYPQDEVLPNEEGNCSLCG